jgi:transaldolase
MVPQRPSCSSATSVRSIATLSAQYLAAADAYLRGIERRIGAGLSPWVASVASLFVSRWDVAVAARVPPPLNLKLGIAVAAQAFRAYNELLASARYRRVLNAGAPVQRLLMASTGTKDPKASDTLYVEALAAPFTIDTMPEATLEAFADHGRVGPPLPADGGDCDAVLARFSAAGVDVNALAARLQAEGALSFVRSWNELMAAIASKSAMLG